MVPLIIYFSIEAKLSQQLKAKRLLLGLKMYYNKLSAMQEAFKKVIAEAQKRGIVVMCSVFSPYAEQAKELVRKEKGATRP